MAQRKKSGMIDEGILEAEVAPKKKASPKPKKEVVEAVPMEYLEATDMLVTPSHMANTTVNLFGESKTDLRPKTGEVLVSKERKELIEQTRTAIARQQAQSLELLVRVRDDESVPIKVRVDAAKDILNRGIGATALVVDEVEGNEVNVSFTEATKDLAV